MISATRRDLRLGSQTIQTKGTNPKESTTTTVVLDNNGAIIPIPGKYFTILGSKISNVNVSYLSYESVKDAQGNIITEDWKTIG